MSKKSSYKYHLLTKKSKVSVWFIFIPILTFLISSCGENSENKVVDDEQISYDCSGLLCTISLNIITYEEYTSILGKTRRFIIDDKKNNSGNIKNIEWKIEGGNMATTDNLVAKGFPGCLSDVCTFSENPTGYIFDSPDKDYNVSVSYEKNGEYFTKEKIIHDGSIPIRASVTMTADDGYQFGPRSGISAQEISYTKTNNSITFTCPQGYGIPDDINIPSAGDETKLNPSASVDNPIFMQVDEYGKSYDGTWSTNNFTVQNLLDPNKKIPDKFSGVTCIKDSNLDKY